MKKNGYGADLVIFTDKDGTLNLKDSVLNATMTDSLKNNILPVVITGRSTEILKDSLKKEGIRIPRYVISDNGAVITDTVTSEIIIKKTISHEPAMEIVDFLKEKGGNPDNMRYFDGKNIYAYDSPEVRKFYATNSAPVVYVPDVLSGIKDKQDLTKIIMGGTKEEIQEVEQFIKDNYSFWIDRFTSKYPIESQSNTMLTMLDNSITKGNAVKDFTQLMHPKKYICIGNGKNDTSMFKQAIDDGMTAVIIREPDSLEVIEEIQEYAKDKQGELVVIGNERNLANKYLQKLVEKARCTAKQESTPKSFKEQYKVSGNYGVMGNPKGQTSNSRYQGRGR